MARHRRKKKLTNKVVAALRPSSSGERITWDTALTGFGVRVTPNNVKSYLIQYRDRTGSSRRYTIGRHGPLSPDIAREMAMQELARIAKGDNPAEEKRMNLNAMTVAGLCDLYLREGCRHKKASTYQTDRARIEWHIKPLLGNKTLSAVRRRDIEQMMEKIAEGQTKTDCRTGHQGRAIVKGGCGVANRASSLLGAIFSFAIRRDLIMDNPCRGVRKYREEGRERFLSGREWQQLENALTRAENRGEHSSAINAIRLLMLTGCRKSEILTLKWSYIDWEAGYLRLPDTKTGKRNIPVGAQVLALLQKLQNSKSRPPDTENPFVIFGSRPGQPFHGLDKVWRRIRKDAGLEGVRLHDLRHSFASMALARGFNLYEIGALLGHKCTNTTARYAHLADDPLKDAAHKTADSITAAMENGKDNNVYYLSQANN